MRFCVCFIAALVYFGFFVSFPWRFAVCGFRAYNDDVNLDEVVRVLKEERRKRGLSLEEVAKLAGWANESVPRKFEKPESNPTLRSVQKYAEALGVSLKLNFAGSRTKIISFFNHAGGVGKSSAVRDFGYVLSNMGFKVLVIDADPQANLTSWLGIREEISLEETLYPAVAGNQDLKLPTPREQHGMSIIPSSLDLALLEPQLVGVIMGVTNLRSTLQEVAGYDFILIDPPPSLGQLSALAVIASDHVVVPVPTNIKGVEGVKTVTRMVQQYRKANPELRISMMLLTQYDERTKHDRFSAEAMSRDLSSIAKVSSPLSHRPAPYKDASLSGLPVPLFAPGSKADEEIRVATGELLEAIGVNVDVKEES